jgi:hypothetical protein
MAMGNQRSKAKQYHAWRNRRVATTTRPYHHGITMHPVRFAGLLWVKILFADLL